MHKDLLAMHYRVYPILAPVTEARIRNYDITSGVSAVKGIAYNIIRLAAPIVELMEPGQCQDYRANRRFDDNIAGAGRPVKVAVREEIFGVIDKNSGMTVRQRIDPVSGFVIGPVGRHWSLPVSVETMVKSGIMGCGFCAPMVAPAVPMRM